MAAVSLNIAGARATWTAAATGTGQVFAADKVDTGTSRTVAEQRNYAAEIWANTVDEQLDQVNEFCNGERSLTALAVGGQVVANAQANADDLVVGSISGAGGFTIFSSSANLGSIHFADATSGSGQFAGAFRYSHSSNSFEWLVGSSTELALDNTDLRPSTASGLNLGRSANRFGTVYAVDGDFSGDLDQNAASPIRTLGDGTGGPVEYVQKGASNNTYCEYRVGTTTAANGKRFGFLSDERFFFDHYDGSSWVTAFFINNEGFLNLPIYSVGGLPAAPTNGSLVYVSNETGGATVAFSDGTNWRRMQDRNIVS